MEAFIGEIRLFAGDYAPEGWKICDGSALNISEYEALHALIGTTWGGSGETFNLPNLSGRVPIGSGQGTGLAKRSLGQTGGATQAPAGFPAHSHRFMASTTEATSTDPNTLMLAKVIPITTDADSKNHTTGLYLKVAGTGQVMANDSVMETGKAALHANVMPSLGLTFIICVFGEFPM